MLTWLAVALSLALAVGNAAEGKTLDEYVQEASEQRQSGELGQAIATMEEAAAAYPDDSDAYSYLGLYLGIAAGQTQDFMEAGRLVQRAFSMLDEAVALDSTSLVARFHRGLLGVQVPEFLGKLDAGIEDLELITGRDERSPGSVAPEIVVGAYQYLGTGYRKRGAIDQARAAWQRVISLAPETESAETARQLLAQLTPAEAPPAATPEAAPKETPDIVVLKRELEDRTDDVSLLVALGSAYVAAGEYEAAESPLRRAIEVDPSLVEPRLWLAQAIRGQLEKGYDARIAQNTNLRTNLAFEYVRVLDEAVELAPDNLELRLMRGAAGVSMPFFVGRLDQGMEDLRMVLDGDVADSARAEALYLLGVAHQKKATTYWIEVATKHPSTEASQAVYESMRPSVERIDVSAHEAPLVVVDFVLGFKDELAPQTAVWVEDDRGSFVKTIYVSGFSGYAKSAQVNLSQWSESSGFVDADAVTGASIDVGDHVYLWDLMNASGDRVPEGDYTVRVEVMYWPSMLYQLVSATVTVGDERDRSVVEEGNLVPYLEVTYLPSSVLSQE
jgi:tetratricopeptide (TPR) repeat protein